MKRTAATPVAVACLLSAGYWMVPSLGAQSSTAALTPPPAYTAPPPGTPPAIDTPVQRQALAKWKAKAEQAVAAERKEYNSAVTPSYNFHYGPKNPFTPGNIQVQGDGFLQPGAYPSAEYCGTCHQEAYSQWRQALHSNAFPNAVLSHQREPSDSRPNARNFPRAPLRQLPQPNRCAGGGTDRRFEGRSSQV
jgi:hypothetical protein